MCTEAMIDLRNYSFIKLSTAEKLIPKKSFTDSHVVEVFKFQNVCDATKIFYIILYAKYDIRLKK